MSADIAYEPLLQHLYHLLRLAEVTRSSGQAPTRRSVLQSTDVLEHLARAHGGQLVALFTPGAAHIQGQLLRGASSVYAMATAIGEELGTLGVQEISISGGLRPDDLLALIDQLARLGAAPAARGASIAVSPRVQLTSRDVAIPAQQAELDSDMPIEDRVIRACAGAMVAMELLYDGMRQGQWQATRLVKHHIQHLLDLLEEAPALVMSFVSAVPRSDPPSLAIKGALLAMATMRHMSQDRLLLRDVGVTAALLDTGLIRACGLMDHASKRGLEFLPRPGEDALDRMPETTATMHALWGQLAQAAMPRALFSYEAHALMRRSSRGMPYDGKFAPTQEAIVIAIVRRYLELTALDLGAGERRSPEDAIQLIWKESTTRLERSALQLFLHTIGFSMRGAPVQLTSGARGVVLGNQGRERALPYPVVRIAYDAQGRQLSPPVDVDLSEMREESLRFGVIRGIVRGHDPLLVQLHEQITSQPMHTPMLGMPSAARQPAPVPPRRRSLPAGHMPPSLDDLANAPLIEGEESLERSQSVALSQNFRLTSPDMSHTDAVRVVSLSAIQGMVPLDLASEDEATGEVSLSDLRAISSLDESTDTGGLDVTGITDQTNPSGRSQDSYHDISKQILVANIPADLMVPLITGIFPIPQPPPGWRPPEEPEESEPVIEHEEATRIIEIPVEPPQRRALSAPQVPTLRPLAMPQPPPNVEPAPTGEATRIIVLPPGLEDNTDATNVLPTSIIAHIQVRDRRDDE